MAKAVKADIIKGCTLKTMGTAVIEGTEVWYVQGVGADGNYGLTALWNAINAENLPTPWSPHPTVPGLNLVSYDPQPTEGGASAYVTLRYVNSNPQLFIRMGTGLVTVQTDQDRYGNPVLLSNYNPSASPPVSGAIAKVTSGIFSYLRPQSTLIIQRVRPTLRWGGSFGVDPKVQQGFVGKVNGADLFGLYPKYTLLCENVGCDNDGFGDVACRYQYEFRYDRAGWNPRVVWVNPDTGQRGTQLLSASGYSESAPGEPSTSGDTLVGKKIVDRCDTADFTPLFS